MKSIRNGAAIGIFALLAITLALPSQSVSDRGRGGGKGFAPAGEAQGSRDSSKARVSPRGPQGGRQFLHDRRFFRDRPAQVFRHRHPFFRHRFVHHRHFQPFLFSFLIFPGWYYDPFYHAYYDPESVLVYTDDPAQYGFISLDVRPAEAEVFVDGEFLGRAEELRDMAVAVIPGEHQLRLAVGNYSTHFQLYVSPRSTSYFSKSLAPSGSLEETPGRQGDPGDAAYTCPADAKEGILAVEAQPRNAMVYVDGSLVGGAEGLAEAGIVLPEGGHRVRVESPGHQPYDEIVQVGCDTPVKIDVELVRGG